MKQQVWLVTGASRGIGLAMVKKLLSLGHTVIGACRNPDGARDLWEIQGDYKSRFRYVKLDVADPATIDALGSQLKDETIDVLVNNAGVLKGAGEALEALSFADVTKSFEVNTIGPMRVTRALLPCLQRSANPKVVNMTSMMGSIEDNKSGGYYAYRMSKTALNMFSVCFAREFPKITVIPMHPGWVKTEMGGAKAPTEAEESVDGIINVVSESRLKDSGQFVDFTGQSIEW
jgi:NAD(P)-dependent dehydrogenase (short-subunit alcohol dehydrogenase family)